MDKKRTQRILGILVIIALVIILFPLIFSKNEVTTETTSMTPPTFPEQQAPSAIAANNDDISNPSMEDNVDTTSTDSADVNDAQSSSSVSDTPQQPSSQESSQSSSLPAPSETPNEAKSNTDTDTNSTTGSSVDTLKQHDTSKTVSDENKQPVKSVTSPANLSKASTHSQPMSIGQSAWVIQVGSFKNKNNARSLADKLRTSGYHAFLKDITLSQGNIRTHVYIGPEAKQMTATKLSEKVQREMSLQGIVVPYKPMAL